MLLLNHQIDAEESGIYDADVAGGCAAEIEQSCLL
jgi:hypothetical protein